MSGNLLNTSRINIFKDGCCRSKERIRMYFKIGRSTKRFVFFEFIYFVLTYVLYICMFPACCFRQRTCVAQMLCFDFLTRPKMPFKVVQRKEVTHSSGSYERNSRGRKLADKMGRGKKKSHYTLID